MSDIPKKDPQLPPATSSEDEDIIDLVEEIGEASPRQPLSALERKLLDLDEKDRTPGRAPDELSELADLGRIDFEEEEEEAAAPGKSPSPAGAGVETDGGSAAGDAARRFGPDAKAGSGAYEKRPPAPSDEIEEISEFDEQFTEPEDLLEGLAALPQEPGSGENEDLELLEIEEEEEEGADDEILWFDDLDKPDQEPPPPATAPEAMPAEASFIGREAEPIQATSAADVFEAHIQSAPAEGGAAAGVLPAAAPEAAAPQTPAEPTPAASDAGAAAAPGLAPEAIEAAVERVIARKLGGTIEAIILQAIEKAVSKEIERLKGLLLEDDAGDRMP